MLEATDTELAKITAAVDAGRLAGTGKIGIRVGKVVGRYKMARHYILDITEDTFAFTRNTEAIAPEAALDGIYVIRTTNGPEQMNPAKVVATYKSLARGSTFSRSRPQGRDQDHHRRQARPELHLAAGPPRHPDPQPPTSRRPRRVRLRPARHPHPHPTPSV